MITPEEQNTAVGSSNLTVNPHPVERADRIQTIDIIRGFALFGILLMNIPGFGIDEIVYFNVLGNAHHGKDYYTLGIIFSFFDGTMRGLFSMVFGAGMILFTMNKKEVKGGPTVAEYYYRRLLWLVAFGLFNAFALLWFGDILFFYGLMGMLLYPFRNSSPKILWVLGLLCMFITVAKDTNNYTNQREKRLAYVAAVNAEKEKKVLTSKQREEKETWLEMEKNFKPDTARSAENVREMRGSYPQVWMQLLPENTDGQIYYTYRGLWDMLCMMLIGMALFKIGFFSNKLENSTYVMLLLLGYGIGITLGIVFFNGLVGQFIHTGFYFDQYRVQHNNLYDIRRLFLCIGHASLLMVVYNSKLVPWLMRALAAVGQMAFTNYLVQSIICTLIFYGYGLGYYDKLRYHELYYVVFGVWILQLIYSPIWLKYFRFGPFEWVWRSLTYWKKQPMKI